MKTLEVTAFLIRALTVNNVIFNCKRERHPPFPPSNFQQQQQQQNRESYSGEFFHVLPWRTCFSSLCSAQFSYFY